ncbi:major facilitator superfamily domain-containing protein [Microdochium bolleyi]|uniref:Major facilitator superfamily domain-containing protein n=1 Tax=Microdochium bolleyi TaxID=196109 RepID=A0A136IKF9_9PEZI|nr:major facilitator superfamily domain-containing protein [Microdochium bolleyi]
MTITATGTHGDDNDFPDGGWAAWSCVFGAWCAFICTFGMFNCAGIFVQIYHDDILKDNSLALIAWIPAVQGFVMDSSTAVVGRAFDSYGPRWLLYTGTAIFIFGTMMTSLSSQYYQFILAQGIVSGFGQACVATTVMACVMTWFRRRRAAALGIAVSGSAVGGVIMPIMLNQLIPRVGFPWALRIVGFMCLALCATACVLVRSRLRPKPQPLLLVDYTGPFRDRTMLLLFVGCFLFFGGMFVPATYIIVQAQAAGVDAALVGYLLPIWSAASIPGRIIPGLLADIIGRYNTTTLLLGTSSLLTLALWLPGVHSQDALIAYAVLFGFASGAIFSLAPACVAQVSKIREVGTRTGIAFALGGVGVLVSPLIAGAILDFMGGRDYMGLQLFCGLEMLGGMACFGAARVRQGGWRWGKI